MSSKSWDRQRWSKIRCASKRSPLDSKAKISFVNRDSPDYRPSYGTVYSPKQQAILGDEIPLSEVPLNQITVLMRKAESMGDIPAYEKAKELRELKNLPNTYKPNLTANDARDILQQLTPWESKWIRRK